MAKKKVINTSKTAHVMNLISKNYDSAPEAASAAENETVEEPKTPVLPEGDAAVGPVTPAAGTAVPTEPVVSAAPAAPTLPLLSADMEITAQIKSALEDLVEDSPAPAAATEEEPVSAAETEETPDATVEESASAAEAEETSGAAAGEPASAAETEETPGAAAEDPASAAETEETPGAAAEEPASAAETEENPAAAAEEESAPVAEETPSMPEAATAEKAIPAQEDPDENICINIMQELVEQSVDRYIKMFGLCSCSRCRADVKAIALTNLVPQYVVAPRREASFRVTIYHERFHGEVTAQILQACRIVMDKPRH